MSEFFTPTNFWVERKSGYTVKGRTIVVKI